MAQYFNDFSQYTVGVAPHDWTIRRLTGAPWIIREDPTAQGGKTLSILSRTGGNNVAIITWDALDADPDRADIEFLIHFKYSTSNASLFAWARHQQDDPQTGYRLSDAFTSSTVGVLGKYVNGAYSNIVTQGGGIIREAERWGFLRASVQGNQLRVKVWYADEAEPLTWRGSGTDNSIAGPGGAGFATLFTGQTDIDWVGVGTGGDPAPMEPVDPGGDDHDFSIASTSHAHRVTTLALAQAHALKPAAATHPHAMQAVGLHGSHVVTVGDIEHRQALAPVTFGQVHLLVLADMLQAHRLAPAILSGESGLQIAPLDHGHGSEAISLGQAHAMVLRDGVQVHKAAPVTLVQAHGVAPAAEVHSHRLSPVSLASEGAIDLASLRHDLDTTLVDLSQSHALILERMAHGQGVSAPEITQGHVLVISDLRHLQALEPAHLDQVHGLVISAALHGHLAAEVDLADFIALPVDEAMLFKLRVAAPIVGVAADPVLFSTKAS